MNLWHDFVQGALPYQTLWLPLAIGMVAGMTCVFVGSRVARSRRQARGPAPEVQSVTRIHDPFIHGSLTEQRRSLRRGGNPVVVVYARPNNTNNPSRGLVLDRSVGGLRLGIEEEIAPGTRLLVLPASATTQTPWIEVDVCGCKPVDDSWELHCQFVKTPQWSILLMFG